jgi:hypothetical protein
MGVTTGIAVRVGVGVASGVGLLHPAMSKTIKVNHNVSVLFCMISSPRKINY